MAPGALQTSPLQVLGPHQFILTATPGGGYYVFYLGGISRDPGTFKDLPEAVPGLKSPHPATEPVPILGEQSQHVEFFVCNNSQC